MFPDNRLKRVLLKMKKKKMDNNIHDGKYQAFRSAHVTSSYTSAMAVWYL